MTSYFNKKVALLLIAIPTLLGAIIATIIVLDRPQPIKIGILHSLTGGQASSEQAAVHGTLSAIEEINAHGGILGRQLEPILADGASKSERFGSEAENLIVHKHVAAIFGGWSVSSRKTIMPIIEKHNSLLFFPGQFAALETSPNIIYNAPTVNQQVIPAAAWAKATLGPNVYVIGSDFISSHAILEIIKQSKEQTGINIVGESFIPLGSKDVDAAIQEIQNLKPHAIINTIKGSSNYPFFKKLHEATTPSIIPTISLAIDESIIADIGIKYLAGHFLICNYFESIASENNKAFVAMMKKKFGAGKRISNATLTTYINVYMWSNAVKKTKTVTDIQKIKKQISSLSFMSPKGPIVVDPETFYEWQPVIIGRILNDGSCAVAWQSKYPLKPQPFPKFPPQAYWKDFLTKKYNEWGQKWERTVQ